MKKEILKLIRRIDSRELLSSDIISWGAPVPVFGDINKSKVATLGLNPSNLEFTDSRGNELEGESRRFHTLNSLRLDSWRNANERHIKKIIKSYEMYFSANPYDRWFRSLDEILNKLSVSYYDSLNHACHLDLVPYATMKKWGSLDTKQKRKLVTLAGDSLASLLQGSPIRVLILNGSSVINHFSELSSVEFVKREMPSWTLCRNSKKVVKGYSYRGEIKSLKNYHFDRDVLVLGYNHNIQSSFGVTRQVKASIANWIKRQAKEICLE